VDKLKPCPFCGSKCEIHKEGNQLMGGCFNDDCDMSPIWILDAEHAPGNISVILWQPVEDTFVTTWNRRAS